jgi:hypothetical protein
MRLPLRQFPSSRAYYLLTPALLWLLGACVTPQSPKAKPDSVSTPSPAAQAPPTSPGPTSPSQIPPSPTSANQPSADYCLKEIPEDLKNTFGEFRLAQATDFVPKIQQLQAEALKEQSAQTQTGQPSSDRPTINYTCTAFAADFNQDQKQDYAVLLVNPKTQASQFRLMIQQTGSIREPKGTFTSLRTVMDIDYPKPPAAIKQPLYVSMLFKPAGEMGPAARTYFPLWSDTPERATFIAGTAIEVWQAPAGYQTDTSSTLLEEQFISRIGYSSDIFYFVDNHLALTGVAD